MTPDEACAKVEIANRKGLDKYCPMSGGTCRHDCVCLALATKMKYAGEYLVYDRYCTNYILTGRKKE